MVSGDTEGPSALKAIVKNKLVEASRVDADGGKCTGGVAETLLDE